MSLDQGTTGSTVSLFEISETAVRLLGSSDQDFPQFFPKPGWVEHNPDDIWSSIETAAVQALSRSGKTSSDVEAIGITNQRETVVAWSRKTGRPLYNAIVWQCRRTADVCEKMRSRYQKKITAKTGLFLDPYFSATKMQWLLKNVPAVKAAAKEKDLCFGTIDSFLIFKLSGGRSHKTDVSNASRTMLMNLKTLNWDLELVKLFGIPLESLPQIGSSASDFGFCDANKFVTSKAQITGVIGDQQSALFGQFGYNIGDAKCTFGTGSFILFNTGSEIKFSKTKCLTTVAWKIKNEKPVYALEGGAFICGAAVQWLRDGLGIIKSSSEVETLASRVQSSEGVEFVPALSGLGAPHWDARARGEITGLTRGSTKAHIAYATLEAMALQNVDILESMQKDIGLSTKKKLKSVRVDGGATANNLLMQMQADYLQVPVFRPKNLETTSLGAALMAAVGAGVIDSLKDIQKLWELDKEFKPKISKEQQKKRRKLWLSAVEKART